MHFIKMGIFYLSVWWFILAVEHIEQITHNRSGNAFHNNGHILSIDVIIYMYFSCWTYRTNNTQPFKKCVSLKWAYFISMCYHFIYYVRHIYWTSRTSWTPLNISEFWTWLKSIHNKNNYIFLRIWISIINMLLG